ncbi:hypothetical protein CC80DRAFT_552203 [Byssothecium circinans]|uniref:Uncharacterized protein n=1 Tax=Byssothecium circinans TaxID=147558 RepID=A0A6A5TKI4_9PLEO|nr:hypothetical protein CC80DRAFT_552203 [Byssothecium circinans]
MARVKFVNRANPDGTAHSSTHIAPGRHIAALPLSSCDETAPGCSEPNGSALLTPPESSPETPNRPLAQPSAPELPRMRPAQRTTVRTQHSELQSQDPRIGELPPARYEANERRRMHKYQHDHHYMPKPGFFSTGLEYIGRSASRQIRHERVRLTPFNEDAMEIYQSNKRSYETAFLHGRSPSSPVFPINPPHGDEPDPLILPPVEGLNAGLTMHPIDQYSPNYPIREQGPGFRRPVPIAYSPADTWTFLGGTATLGNRRERASERWRRMRNSQRMAQSVTAQEADIMAQFIDFEAAAKTET